MEFKEGSLLGWQTALEKQFGGFNSLAFRLTNSHGAFLLLFDNLV
jgi:hypothetical protein